MHCVPETMWQRLFGNLLLVDLSSFYAHKVLPIASWFGDVYFARVGTCPELTSSLDQQRMPDEPSHLTTQYQPKPPLSFKK